MQQDTMPGRLGSKSMEGQIRMSSCCSMTGFKMITRVDILSISPYSMRWVWMTFQVKSFKISISQIFSWMIKIKSLAKFRHRNPRIPRSKLRKPISKFNSSRCSIKMAPNYQRKWHRIIRSNLYSNNNRWIILMTCLLKKWIMMGKHQDRDQEVLAINFKELRGTPEQMAHRHENRNKKA